MTAATVTRWSPERVATGTDRFDAMPLGVLAQERVDLANALSAAGRSSGPAGLLSRRGYRT